MIMRGPAEIDSSGPQFLVRDSNSNGAFIHGMMCRW